MSGKKLVLWMCTVFLAALVLADGALRVFQLRLMVAQFESFGYGTGALRSFGAAELLAGILLLTPLTRLAGAGLTVLLMALAVFTYISTGARFSPAPAVVAVLSLALIWMHLEQRLPRSGKP